MAKKFIPARSPGAATRGGPSALRGLGMIVPRFASTPVCGQSAPNAAYDFWPSGENLNYLRRSAMPYGRQLRGLGLVPDSATGGDTWSGSDPAVLQAEQDDDVAGNGIFDGAGAPPTAHAQTGVFASHFSLPGYLYREQPTEPSEVRDTTTGLPVVFQPNAGGSWYSDVRESYRPFDLETPRMYRQRPRYAPAHLPELGLTVRPPEGVDLSRVRFDASAPVGVAAPLPVASGMALALRGLGAAASPTFSDVAKAYGPWIAGGAMVGVGIALVVRAMSRPSYGEAY